MPCELALSLSRMLPLSILIGRAEPDRAGARPYHARERIYQRRRSDSVLMDFGTETIQQGTLVAHINKNI